METWERELAERDRTLAVTRQQLFDRERELAGVKCRLIDKQTAWEFAMGAAIILGACFFLILGVAIQSGILK